MAYVSPQAVPICWCLPSSLGVLGDKVDFYHPVRGEGVQKLVGPTAEQGGICRCDRDAICSCRVLVSAYRGDLSI